MISGLPRPAIAGSASRAPSWAALRIKGRGLISVFIGEKPETTPGDLDEDGLALIGDEGVVEDGAEALLVRGPRLGEGRELP